MTTDASAIRVERVTKRYRDITALNDVTLSVAAGERLGLIGPNGAGKTTLIRILADLARPTSGSVQLFGLDTRTASSRLSVGFLHSTIATSRGQTVREAIEFIDLIRRTSSERNALELTDRLGLALDRPTSELSTGNRQKLGIVLAFMHQPRLLVLDEPITGLDPIAQNVLHDLIDEVAATGTTVLISSHLLGEVQTVSDRIVAVNGGSVMADATLAELAASAGRGVSIALRQPNDAARAARCLTAVTLTAGPPTKLTGTLTGPVGPLLDSLHGLDVLDLTIGDPSIDDALLALYSRSEAL